VYTYHDALLLVCLFIKIWKSCDGKTVEVAVSLSLLCFDVLVVGVARCWGAWCYILVRYGQALAMKVNEDCDRNCTG
jgi:hypothetical protein